MVAESRARPQLQVARETYLQHSRDTLHVQMGGLKEDIEDAREDGRVEQLINHDLLSNCKHQRTLIGQLIAYQVS